MCFGSNEKVEQAPLKRSKTTGKIKKARPDLKERKAGKTFNDLAKTGPYPKRSCTDFPCLVIFIAFICFKVYYSTWAYTKGNPWLLAQPYDIDSNPCGAANTVTENYKYAYFFDPVNDLTGTICLKNCPTWKITESPPTTLGECYLGLQGSIKTGQNEQGAVACSNAEFINFNESVSVLKALTDTKARIYNTSVFIDRFCIPDMKNLASTAKSYYEDITSKTSMDDKFEEYFSDLKNSYMIISASSLGALVVCITYMFLLQCCVGIFVWVMILGFFAILILLAIYSHRKANYYQDIYDETKNETYKSSHQQFYYTALGLDILAFLLFCLMCCYMTTIELCIAVLKSAAIFLRKNFCIILLPIVMTILMVGYSMYWAITLLYAWSVGDYVKRTGLPLGAVQWTTFTRAIVYTHMFAILWVGCTLLYYSQFVTILATCIWYFNHDSANHKNTYKKSPVFTAICWALIYHLGSIAFAAFILAAIIAARLMLYYIEWQVNKLTQREGKKQSCMLKFAFRCLHCVLKCAERLIKQINKTGFMAVALKSQYFCLSCFEGFTLVMRNPLKFGLLGILGEIFTFIGKIFVATITAGVGYYIINNYEPYTKTLYSPFLPTVFFFCIGMVIGSIFMSLYGLSADAIMFCYFVERNSGVDERDMNCPPPMKEFFLSNKSSSSEDEKRRLKSDNYK